MSTADPKVFAWITGQDFNIGDSLLRRPYVEELARIGPVDLWVRGASDEFLTGLGTGPFQTHRTFGRWYLRALSASVRRPTVIALNAGEVWVSWNRAALILLLAMLSTVARLRGGTSVWLGASIQATSNPILRTIYRVAINSIESVWWRDPRSNATGLKRAVGPDWAFLTGSPVSTWTPSDERSHIAFVVRGDRQRPGSAWIDWARRAIRDTGLSPVFVVQVDSDRKLAYDLASEFGGRVLDWPAGRDHDTHECAVRDLYRTSAVAVGDRLHGLIVAATEGAVPVGWVDTSSGKIAAHFDAVDMQYVGEFEGSKFADAPRLTPEAIAEHSRDLPRAIDASRQEIRHLLERYGFPAPPSDAP